MRGKGINYDTGFSPGGHSSREHFDAGIVRAEMRVIARELRCTAVRISGGDPGRLTTAGEWTGGRHRRLAATPDNPHAAAAESAFGPGPAGASPLPRLDMLLRFALP
jgi:hypothetical protein